MISPSTGAHINKLVDYVHLAETSRGTNTNPIALHNYCKTIGKSNEFGYDPYTKRCFDSHEQARQRVYRWFQEKLVKMSEGEALCHYNVGTVTEDCDYHRNYLAYGQ